MGEQVYSAEDMSFQFSDSDDEWSCLCRFPGTHDTDRVLDIGDVRSLALLGAAVVLAHNEDMEYGILPYCVPEWIRNEIIRATTEPNNYL